MRKIGTTEIVVFLCLLASILLLGIASTAWLLAAMPLGDFRGVVLLAAALVLSYLWAFAMYRLCLRLWPLHEGSAAPGSRAEFAANLNILFYLLLFNSLIRTHVIPLPLMRLVYLAGIEHLQRRRLARSAVDDHRQQCHRRPRRRGVCACDRRRAAGIEARRDR